MILFCLFIIVLLVSIDQYTKSVVLKTINLLDKHEVIPNFFYITNVRNTGAAWSILEGKQTFFIIITFIAIAVFVYLLYKDRNKSKLLTISYLLIISGAIGNLIDRITNAYVVDFLDFYIFGYDFPVFNVADSFLTIGVILIFIYSFLEYRSGKNKTNSK